LAGCKDLAVAFLLFVVSVAAYLLMLTPSSACAQGGVPLWTNSFGGWSIAADSNGNVFVYGSSPDIGGTIKYSTDGVPLWTNSCYGPLAVDSNGNLFAFTGSGVMKYSRDGVPLWPKPSPAGFGALAVNRSGNVFVTEASSSDPTTFAYSSEGVLLWTNRYSGKLRFEPGVVGNGGMVVDENGNVIVTGTASDRDPGDYLTIKYSNAGVSLWTNRFSGPGSSSDVVQGISVDESGNVFVTGFSNNGQSISTSDFVTVAYSNSGVPLWTNRYNGPANGIDLGYAIAVDNNGNVFVTGESYADLAQGYTDNATIKYSNSGVPLWTNYYAGPGNNNDVLAAIAVDGAGNVFVTGWSFNTPSPDFSVDWATIAYSSEGSPLWEDHYIVPGPWGGIPGVAIAVDPAGNVFVTVYPLQPGAYQRTVKYSSSVPPPVQLGFQLLNNQLVLSWTNSGFNLQSAPAVTGPFTNLPAATSPYTNVTTSAQQFFRLSGN